MIALVVALSLTAWAGDDVPTFQDTRLSIQGMREALWEKFKTVMKNPASEKITFRGITPTQFQIFSWGTTDPAVIEIIQNINPAQTQRDFTLAARRTSSGKETFKMNWVTQGKDLKPVPGSAVMTGEFALAPLLENENTDLRLSHQNSIVVSVETRGRDFMSIVGEGRSPIVEFRESIQNKSDGLIRSFDIRAGELRMDATLMRMPGQIVGTQIYRINGNAVSPIEFRQRLDESIMGTVNFIAEVFLNFIRYAAYID